MAKDYTCFRWYERVMIYVGASLHNIALDMRVKRIQNPRIGTWLHRKKAW